jgi:hypothetical protein
VPDRMSRNSDPNRPVKRQTEHSPEEIYDYWTKEMTEEAVPLPVDRQPSLKPERRNKND